MDRCFRIYTENKNKADVAALASARFDGFTMYEAEGYWKGVPEKSLVVEILGSIGDFDLVVELGEAIKNFNHQESVLIQSATNHSDLIQ
jgi:hypothetical protein